ncbi:Phosphoenolpyruvate pyruvate protein, partial [Rhizoctonia solani]
MLASEPIVGKYTGHFAHHTIVGKIWGTRRYLYDNVSLVNIISSASPLLLAFNKYLNKSESSNMVVQPIETSSREYTIPAHLRHSADEPLSTKASTRLRQMLARPGIVVAPGVCDGISARCALEAGFDCLYQSGAATTAAKLGMPDLAIATLPDFVQNATMITGLSYSTPLIADADTGFGGPAMVARTVQMYDRAGVAALHIEDQVQTKRCGHLLGKQVVSTEEFVTRIRAAVQARDAIPGSDIVVIARTDSAQVLGMDEAIRRLQAAASVGADVAFIEGVKTKELLEKTVKALHPTPVLVNVISGGLTPSFTTKEAEEMGAKIIIFSLVSCVAAAHGIREAMALLKKTGTDHTSARGMDPRKFFEVVGLDEVIEVDRRAGGTALSSI